MAWLPGAAIAEGSSTADAPFFDWQPETAATTTSARAIPGKVRSGFPSGIA
ncbi:MULTISPECIES: hypothetical protein [unclassified Mesorhizobium]|uniref:hypothetical protein n=1 Tax=unclassified Mesorhizobium TaxID=325217 RepID=UPI001FE1D827|nr:MULTISPECIES: hypothetical protein [unclassified Mesorhizobium]